MHRVVEPDAHTPHYLEAELYERVRADPAIFDFLQNGSLDGIWFWDLENPDHEWMSRRFWEVLGHDPEGKPHDPTAWQDLIHPDDLKAALANFEAHCADPDHPYDQVVRYTRADGGTSWVRCRGLAIRDGSGRPIRMLGAHSDITAMKEAEVELRKRAEQLEQSNHALESANIELKQYGYVVAHDLKAPLRHITAFVELLERGYADQLDERGQGYLAFVRTGAARLKVLIEDLLTYARADRKPNVEKPVDLSAVAEEVQAYLEIPDEAVLEIAPLPTVLGDRAQLGQVLQNLLENALKFRKPGTPATVAVRAEPDGAWWAIEVTDQGIGIRPKFQDRIFQVFNKLHGDDEYAGTGIGLAICKRIVERHGGRISVTSAPDAGTTIRFTLRGHSEDVNAGVKGR